MTPNNFNTAPNGNTVVDVNSILSDPATLVLDSTTTPYIDGIISLNPTKTTFVFSAGVYKLNSVLTIRRDNVRFIGLTGVARDVQILQMSNTDGIAIRANSILFQDLYVKCNYSGKVCLTGASTNNTVIAGCYFYGAPDTFTMFFAGPSGLTEGASTLSAYTAFNLDTGNRIYNNVFYSKFSGDSVSFCLQYKSYFASNFIRGGKLAVYMCRTCNIYGNFITDSTAHGLYISLPSDTLSVVGNKVINSFYSGIVIKDQLEHGSFVRYPYNIIVRNNFVFGSKSYAVELNNATNVTISNNNLVANQTIGIYSYNGINLTIKSNKIAYFRYGVYLEKSTLSNVTNNNVMSIYPNLGDNGVKITSDSSTNNVNNNTMKGEYLYDLIADSGMSDVIGTNPTQTLYSISEEKNLFNVI